MGFTTVMKFIVGLFFALLAVVDAGVQIHAQDGSFAHTFTTQQDQAIPLFYQHPMNLIPKSFPQIIYDYTIDPSNKMDYSNALYSPYYLYQFSKLNEDELFRVGDDVEESKWFTSNPGYVAHPLPTPVTSTYALATTSNSGSTAIPSFSSASNAVFQYPFLSLFHRLFNRRPLNRPLVSSAPPIMRPVLNNINDSIFTESFNLINPFYRPRP